jgi:hypothetical protein
MPGTRLVDRLKFLRALHSVTPSSSSPKWVSLKGFNHITIVVGFKNATTVTGSAIALAQATAVAGTGTKTLAFTKAWSVVDDASAVALTEMTVASNTFTTDATDSKTGFYIIEVDADDLDINNGFDCIRATAGNATAATITIDYILSGSRYGGEPGSFANPLAD